MWDEKAGLLIDVDADKNKWNSSNKTKLICYIVTSLKMFVNPPNITLDLLVWGYTQISDQ